VAVLGIDTAGAAGSVAVVDHEQVLASLYVRVSPARARPVLRTIDLLLKWLDLELHDLAALAVNIGPGAFTGLRVGLAVAQGLALASGKPLFGCSAFDALVTLAPEWEGTICPVLEARKGELYTAFYQRQGRVLRQTSAGMLLKPEDLCARVSERTLFLGSGVQAYAAKFAAALGDRAVCRQTGVEEAGLAICLARYGRARLLAGAAASLTTLEPLYIRPADARLPRHIDRVVEETAPNPARLMCTDGSWLSREGNDVMLDGIDDIIIERAKQENPEFCRLLEKHQTYEQQLDLYNDLKFLTNEQEVERKRLQKLKLQGKDRMLSILRQYQQA
jgi:tRNA threonylcarbamoyladenosine biosynthesis protein TsaB